MFTQKKFHQKKIHPKNFHSKKFSPKKFSTQIVRLSFVDLRWAQLYVSLVFACSKIIKQKQIFTCSRKHGSIPKGQFQWVFQTGQSQLFHFWPVSKGGSVKIDDSVCLWMRCTIH